MILSFNIEYRTNWGEEVGFPAYFRNQFLYTPLMVSIGRQKLSLKSPMKG